MAFVSGIDALGAKDERSNKIILINIHSHV